MKSLAFFPPTGTSQGDMLINLILMPVAPTAALPGAVETVAPEPMVSRPAAVEESVPHLTSPVAWLSPMLRSSCPERSQRAHDVTITSDATWYSHTLTLGDLSISSGAALTLAGASGTRLIAGRTVVFTDTPSAGSGKAWAA